MDLKFLYIIIAMLVLSSINYNRMKTGNNEIISIIEQNHSEVITLISGKYKTKVEFLESLKKSRANRIKKGDELR